MAAPGRVWRLPYSDSVFFVSIRGIGLFFFKFVNPERIQGAIKSFYLY